MDRCGAGGTLGGQKRSLFGASWVFPARATFCMFVDKQVIRTSPSSNRPSEPEFAFQTPVCLCLSPADPRIRRSTGSAGVWVDRGHAGLAKRQWTLHLTVCADPADPQPPPCIVFRGKGKIKQTERDRWHPGVCVLFQKNAWVDRATLCEWYDRSFGPWLDTNHEGRKPSLCATTWTPTSASASPGWPGSATTSSGEDQ